ncbi:MAG: NAD-dependent epimerase/dehydratase family protein [Candidatus Parcubacteria bacterium]|nr:NAD-dependent epimerase/dehydratase family protein [Candidatus Parcubacteria bacterium]
MNKLEKILQEDAVAVNKKVNLTELLEKEIIITGASGLIGINFLMSLKEFSRKVGIQKSPKVTAIFHNEIPEYLKEVLNFENLSIKNGDVTDENFIKSLPFADCIVHAAGYGQPGKFMRDEVKTIAINTTATISLLKKLKPEGKFLFVSSSEVYSCLPHPPYKEEQIGTTNTTHPRACYIEGKRCGEAICHAYYKKGINAKSARLSLAYGPGTRAGDMRVLNSFIEKGMSGKIEMMDRGEAKRTYCYVSDAVEIMWNILLSGKNPIYNVGGFSILTISGLAKKIGKIMNAEVIFPKITKELTGAPSNVRLDMGSVSKEFKKTKKDYKDIDSGLANTIAWQKEIYKF